MDETTSQNMEIFNETTILISSVLLAPYFTSEFGPEQANMSLRIGWILSGLTLGNVLVNELLMVSQICSKIFQCLKPHLLKLFS
jgi:hypothetical protein